MYVNAKMTPVESVPGIQREGWGWGGEWKGGIQV
jgi:hypothetical protein